MNLWTPSWFRIEELVPPELFETYKDKQWKLWLMFDNRILKAADLLRDKFGPATINNWLWGGQYKASGLRAPESEYYSLTSQHAWGRALDLKFRDYDAETIRQAILRKEVAPGLITGIEADVSWNHIDCRIPTGTKEIFIFKK